MNTNQQLWSTMYVTTFAAASESPNATTQAISASIVVPTFLLPSLVELVYKALRDEIRVSTGNNACQRTMILLLLYLPFVNRRQPIQISSQMSSRRVEVQLLHLARNRACLSVFYQPMINLRYGRNSHRSAGEKQLVTNIQFAAVDGALHNLDAQFPLRQLHHCIARDALQHVFRCRRSDQLPFAHHKDVARRSLGNMTGIVQK